MTTRRAGTRRNAGGRRGAHEPSARADGSILVLALTVMLVWSVVVFAVLDLARSGFDIAAGGHAHTERVYAADAAVTTVVAALVAEDDDVACSDDVPAATVATLVFNGQQVTVDCVRWTGPNVRVVDLTASIDAVARLQARVELDDSGASTVVRNRNWTVVG